MFHVIIELVLTLSLEFVVVLTYLVFQPCYTSLSWWAESLTLFHVPCNTRLQPADSFSPNMARITFHL